MAYSYRLCANDWLQLDLQQVPETLLQTRNPKQALVCLACQVVGRRGKLRCNISKCNEDGTGEVYLGLPQGIVKVFSCGYDKFAISLVGAVIISDIHADMAREFCKELNAKENRIRYSVGFEPAFSKTGISMTCDFEEDGDDETTEYDILSYAKTYFEPKQQELQTIWTHKMKEIQ